MQQLAISRPDVVERLVRVVRPERWMPSGTWGVALFHHLTQPSPLRAEHDLVHGLGIALPETTFRAVLDIIESHFNVVSLDDIIDGHITWPRDGHPPLVICFDDAYRSVAEIAAPELERRGLPWTFFVSPGLIGNDSLGFDNLLAYVMNRHGPAAVHAASGIAAESVGQLLTQHVCHFDPSSRAQLAQQLIAELEIDDRRLARRAALYINSEQLHRLSESGVTIGNHTADHVHCRALDTDDLVTQVVDAKSRLESIVGKAVRAFAYPYGSRTDATPAMTRILAESGHEAAFLVEGRVNDGGTSRHELYRVSVTVPTARRLCTGLTVLPMMRAMRERLKQIRPGKGQHSWP